MTALALLTLLTVTAADSIIVPPERVGLVPTLRPPPENLPLAEDRPGGTWLPGKLAVYVAEEVSALWRYPELAQKALDIAIDVERAQCDLRVQDAEAVCPTFADKLRSGLLWGFGGIVCGVLATLYAASL